MTIVNYLVVYLMLFRVEVSSDERPQSILRQNLEIGRRLIGQTLADIYKADRSAALYSHYMLICYHHQPRGRPRIVSL